MGQARLVTLLPWEQSLAVYFTLVLGDNTSASFSRVLGLQACTTKLS